MPKKEKGTGNAIGNTTRGNGGKRTAQEILKDPSLTYEDWKKELTEAYREEILTKSEVLELDEEIADLQKQITESLNDPTKMIGLAENLKDKQEMRGTYDQEADTHAKRMMFAAHTEREGTEFAAEPKDLERGIKSNKLQRRHGDW